MKIGVKDLHRSRSPLGLNPAAQTGSLCPVNMVTTPPDLAGYTMEFPSCELFTTSPPLGLNPAAPLSAVNP